MISLPSCAPSVTSSRDGTVRNARKTHSKRGVERPAGRLAAMKAHSRLGVEAFDIANDPEGAPVFPEGFAGSISHADGLACAVTASRNDNRSVGVDVELASRRVSPAAAEHIANDDEKQLPVNLVFSIKETRFKAIYPLVRKRFSFDAASIVSIGENTFSVRLNTDLSAEWHAGSVLEGFWEQEGDYAMTILAVK
jgi:enterobactin synthetase component D